MLVACWSPKGGVGKSLLATALALHLQAAGYRTLLVDLDPEKADLATLLQCPDKPSLLDWPLMRRDGQRQSLPATVEGPEGLRFLPGPGRLVDEWRVDRSLCEELLGSLAAWRGPVVVDLCSSLRDSTLLTLEQAERVFLVSTPELLSLRAVHHFSRDLDLIGLDAEKFRLVVNRTGAGVHLDETAELFPFALAGTLPGHLPLARAVSSGAGSRALLQPNPFTRAVQSLAEQELVPVLGPPRSRERGRRKAGRERGRSGRVWRPGTGWLPWKRR